MTNPANELENFILQRLQKLGMSKAELMRRAELSRTVYYNLIAGNTNQARLSTVFKLADALKLHPMRILRLIVKDMEALSHTEATTLYKCDVTGFVQDVTIPDNALVAVNQVFVKTWEIQNLGKVPWIGRQLICVDEPVQHVAQAGIAPFQSGLLVPDNRCIVIPDTLPEAHVLLSVQFTAPAHPCTVVSYWKMVDEEGKLCFPDNQGLYAQVKVMAI